MARPTARGWGLVLVAAGIYLAARVVGTWELYLLAVAFAAAVLVSWLLVSFSSRRLAVTRLITPAQPLAGDRLAVTFRLDQAPPLPGLQVVLRGVAGDLGAGDEELEFDALGLRRTRAAAGPWTARRGVHRLPPMPADMDDPLGLAHTQRLLGEARELVVYPRLVALSSCVLFGGDGRRREQSRRGLPAGGATEFRGIRPHTPGESLDHIDWKATAKWGSLMLRELDDPASGGVTVLLAGSAGQVLGQEPDTNYELAVQAAGALAGYALRAGRQVTLVLGGRDWRRTRLAPGVAGQEQLLERLARSEPHQTQRLGASLHTLLAGADGRRAGLVVLVVLALDRDLVRAAAAQRREGVALAVVHVDGQSFSAPPPAPAAAPAAVTAPPDEQRALLLSLQTAGVQCVGLAHGADLSTALSAWSAAESVVPS
jgi:uncharacterized protein (DUF58 family)